MLRCLLLIFGLSCALQGQQTGGTLKGTVTDPMGSLVVGARITIKNARGVVTSATSNTSGVYEFRRVEPGTYQLQVIAPGFNVFEEKDVEIEAREVTTLNPQLTIAFEEQQVTIDDRNISTDSDNNASAVVLRGKDLEALPNDPAALASALQALAGPPDPENATQIKVDGFSNGQIPPKEAIREVRINNNPFSAENEFPGFSGIEIFTQPGADKWHGAFSFDFNDEALNSRNPFTSVRAPYQQRSYNASLSGPIIPKRTSFSAYFGRYVSDGNSVVNATTLDPVTLKPVVVNETFITPEETTYGNARVDFKINKMHTLVARFNVNTSTQDLQGIGGFSLPSRAYSGRRSNFVLQVTETALINEKTVNETRFQFIRNRFNQGSVVDGFALNVLESFFGGGSQVGASSNAQNRLELQNFTSWTRGNHFLKAGVRLRHSDIESISPGNFGGTYTFGGGFGPLLDANDQIIPGPSVEISSLERYRRTLVFSRAGLSTAEIRLLGGGATQFSIAGGNPEVHVKQTDAAFYIQDEWKVRPNFTLSPGLRYENQTNIDSNFNFAPRIGFAWSPVFGGGKRTAASPTPAKPAAPAAANPTATTAATAAPAPAPAAPASAPPGPPKTVIRGGFGIFYNRLGEDITLNATRFDGTKQQQFLVTDPAVLDLFPVVPPIDLLDSFSQPQVRRVVSDDMQTFRSLRTMFTVERMLPKKVRLSLSYSHSRFQRLFRSVNINAPLAGTFIPGQSNSGVRPFGNEAGNIFEYQSTGRSVGNSFNISVNGTLMKINFFGGYALSKTRGTDSGSSGSPFDAYDFSNEYARSPWGALSFAHFSANYTAPYGVTLSMFGIANSGHPFNITTGQDTNGDTLFTERPAFATDPNEPGVVMTPFGALDPTPEPGQKIIPRNIGRAPGFVFVSMSLGKAFKFGPAIEPKTPPPGAPRTTDAGSAQTPPKPAPVQRPYTLAFSINANNVFNRTNAGAPVGNMSSPYFLKSPSGSSTFFFGPGGGSSGNRVISLRVRFSF